MPHSRTRSIFIPIKHVRFLLPAPIETTTTGGVLLAEELEEIYDEYFSASQPALCQQCPLTAEVPTSLDHSGCPPLTTPASTMPHDPWTSPWPSTSSSPVDLDELNDLEILDGLAYLPADTDRVQSSLKAPLADLDQAGGCPYSGHAPVDRNELEDLDDLLVHSPADENHAENCSGSTDLVTALEKPRHLLSSQDSPANIDHAGCTVDLE